MGRQNSCYTYFAIKGNFNPDDITAKLGLSPSHQWCVGDLRKNGTAYDFALWEYGRCEDYDMLTDNQMRQTISELIPKVQELKDIKLKYDVSFVLEVVPSVYAGESAPCLAPDRTVIEFCYHTETDIDIDLYVFDSDDVE